MQPAYEPAAGDVLLAAGGAVDLFGVGYLGHDERKGNLPQRDHDVRLGQRPWRVARKTGRRYVAALDVLKVGLVGETRSVERRDELHARKRPAVCAARPARGCIA